METVRDAKKAIINLQEAAQLSSVLLVCGIVFGRPVLPEEWRNMQTSEIAGLYSRVG